MIQEILLPKLDQSMEEAEILLWKAKVGDSVRKGDVICEIQTDKAAVEIESTATGVLRHILVEENKTVPANTVIAIVADEGEEIPPEMLQATGPKESRVQPGGTQSAPSEASKPPAPAPASPKVERPSEPNVAPSTTVEEITVPLEPGYIRPGRKAISPRAKKLAEELGLPILPIDGSGAEGRIREADVRAYHEAVKDIEFAPGARELCRERNVDLRVFLRTSERPVTEEMARAAPPITGGKPEPLSNMRAIIADRLSRSKRAIPHFYLTTAVDMSAAVEFRLSQQKKHSFNDLLIKAVGLALREFPRVASVYTPQGYVRRDHMNVGLAVATESGGLVVPVIRDADMLSLDEISTRTRELIDKARKGRTDPSDCAGGAFTVSNLGMYPVDEFVAIINPGEAAILAVGAMIETPVARDGEVQVRPMMKMTLSCDHRVIDGAMAAAFNARIKALLESPAETLAGDGDQ